MLGIVKAVSVGAVLSCGVLAAYEGPTSRLDAAAEIRPAPARMNSATRPVRAASKADLSSPCQTARRKLWVDGEGWIVKTVARC